MAIAKKTLKDSLVAKDLSYTNEFFNLKHDTIATSDSFTYNAYVALNDVMDAKTNNYSNLFLSKKQENSDWLEVNEKQNTDKNLISTLSFYSNSPDDLYNPGIWLYFDKTYEFWDIYVKDAPYALTYSRPDDNLHGYFFYIEYLDDATCRISHNFGDLTFYLSCDESLNLQFNIDDNPKNIEWQYTFEDAKTRRYSTLQENKLRLYKTITDKDGNKTVYSLVAVQSEDPEDNNWYLKLVTEVEEEDINSAIIYINDAVLQMDVYLDNSYVGYDQSKYITAINRGMSAFHLQAQALLHHQYNADGGMNFIPLKSNANYQGGHARGSNLTISTQHYPDVSYRDYNMIHSGINQERGNDTIILNYHFTDQVYRLKDGGKIEFYIPSKEENGGVEPIWPYKKMNIVDSKFIKNGAFASSVPYFSDRVSKLQGPYSICLDEDGRQMSANNGTYLCTWLYAKNELNFPIWVDRYYYPDKISRIEALQNETTLTDAQIDHFKQSFENIIDKNYDIDGKDLKDTNPRELIREATYFDKVSDLVFEPHNTYKYERISTAMVNEVNDKLNEVRIQNVENQNGELTYLSDLLKPDNKNWLRIAHDAFKNTNKVNINFDIHITPEKRIGMQLFGADYKAGFNIQNRKDLAPFHYYATEKEMYLLNNDFEIKRKFDLYGKYSDNIVKFLVGDVFDDVIVITNLYLYIFAWDLRLKSRIYYSDILGLNELTALDGTSMFGYPYADFSDANKYTEWQVEYTPKEFDLGQQVVMNQALCSIDRFDNSWIFDYKNPGPLYFIDSTVASVLADQNAQIYNNNVYIPYNQNIIKLIFVADSEYDDFDFDMMEHYPCKARVLGQDEFTVNYVRTGDDVVEEVAMENGFIEVENKLKHVYVNEKGQVFGFNFDKIAMSSDGDTMYGLYAWDKYVHAGGWNWLYNQSISRMQAAAGSAKFAEFGSEESIDNLAMNEHGDMLLVRGFDMPSDDVTKLKRFEIYDITKKRVYQRMLNEFDEVLCADAYNYITEDDQEKSVFMVLARMGEYVYKMEYDVINKSFTQSRTELPAEMNPRFYQTTNSNSLTRYANENKLYFNLYLPTNFLYDHREQIVWDIAESQEGWYNVNVHIDLDAAEFKIKINDIEYESISNTPLFQPHIYSNGMLFDSTYYVGTIGKQYGTTLDKIISVSTHDPYTCKNTKIENMRIYTRSLDYYEYQAMRLDGKPINEIALTLPCGQRTNIEEIVRYFKYTPPAAISNKVKINISGTGLSTRGELQLLEKEIRTVLENEKDCLVDVAKVEFI